jgi:hypothetical protein
VSATTDDKWIDPPGTPDFYMRICQGAWQKSGNPFFVWRAVALCTEYKMPLPDWITNYLSDVAQRMTSDAQKDLRNAYFHQDATAATDLRAVLPGIMGFPAKQGPGHPLHPCPKIDDLLLAGWFAIEIVDRGLEPTQALREAATHLPPEAAGRDEKTLWRWLMKAVDLKRRPSTNAQWKAALRSRYRDFTAIVFLDILLKQKSR